LQVLEKRVPKQSVTKNDLEYIVKFVQSSDLPQKEVIIESLYKNEILGRLKAKLLPGTPICLVMPVHERNHFRSLFIMLKKMNGWDITDNPY